VNKKGVFISYRRETGADVARVIQSFLEGKGYDVFLDVDTLQSGHFDDQLLAQIGSRKHFVIICSSGALDRCVEPSDWVRLEISHALASKCNVVPVMLPGFTWKPMEALPPEIASLRDHNAFQYSHSHWGHTRHELLKFLRKNNDPPLWAKWKALMLRVAVAAIVVLLGILAWWILRPPPDPLEVLVQRCAKLARAFATEMESPTADSVVTIAEEVASTIEALEDYPALADAIRDRSPEDLRESLESVRSTLLRHTLRLRDMEESLTAEQSLSLFKAVGRIWKSRGAVVEVLDDAAAPKP
jgi:hypothetical protein